MSAAFDEKRSPTSVASSWKKVTFDRQQSGISPRPHFFQLVHVAHGFLAVTFVLFERELDCRPQARMIIIWKRNKFEGLKFPRKRSQHFGSTKHRPSRRQKHKFRHQALSNWARKRKQAASDGNDFQMSGCAIAIGHAQDGRGGFGKPNT